MLTGERTMEMRQTLDFYAQPAVMTSAGDYAPRFDDLPREVTALTSLLHGLVIHEHIAPSYGVTLSDERRGSVHIRPVARILERLLAEDDRPLATARPAATRIAGNCRHFSVLLTAMLRHQGVPARARCRFGGYWWIAGNLMRDVAALNNMEMLPWDVWGAMPGPGELIEDEQLALFDRLAALTRTPDTAFAELQSLYEGDDPLRVPPTVHNAVLNREDDV